jgi:hypothetical protein
MLPKFQGLVETGPGATKEISPVQDFSVTEIKENKFLHVCLFMAFM